MKRTVLNVLVRTFGPPISVSNSAYEIAHMQNEQQKKCELSHESTSKYMYLVCVYVRRSLPNGFIYCSLNGIFHHDENSLLFIHFIQTENIFECECVFVCVENRLKYL